MSNWQAEIEDTYRWAEGLSDRDLRTIVRVKTPGHAGMVAEIVLSQRKWRKRLGITD